MSDPTTYTPEQIAEALEWLERVAAGIDIFYSDPPHKPRTALALAQMAARMLEEGPQAYKWYGPRSLSDMEAVEHITKGHPKSDRALHFVSKHVRPLYALPTPEEG
jgi:hypothetical protein